MSRDSYEVVIEKSQEESLYPHHVKQRIEAYKDAGLKYKIETDTPMRRSIVFEQKKRMFPEKYSKRIENLFRLRDPDTGDEFIIYDTLESVTDDSNLLYQDNINYGLDVFIKTNPVYDKRTGMLSTRDIVRNEFRYTIKYTPEKIKEILDTITEDSKEYNTQFYIADISKGPMSAEKKWSGDRIKVQNKNNFIHRTFDELVLMKLTVTNTPEEARSAAKTIRDERGLISDLTQKDRIMKSFNAMENIKKK